MVLELWILGELRLKYHRFYLWQERGRGRKLSLWICEDCRYLLGVWQCYIQVALFSRRLRFFFFFSVRGPSFRRELYFWSWFCWPVVISKTALGIYSYFEQRSCPLRMLGFWPWAQSVSSLKQTRKLRVQGAMLDSVEVTAFKKSQEVYSQTEILYLLWPWFGSSPDCWSAFYGHLRSRIVSLFSSFPFHVVC